MRYKRWLWWTRFAMMITVLQFMGAVYLMIIAVNYISHYGKSSDCFLGRDPNTESWKQNLLLLFLISVSFMVVIQCFTGFDILKWRSFYETHDNVWKAHYREVFDHGIREALCCLGRVKYLSVLEEDEVYLVAQLLGDLVTYRASGTGHLEFLAGLALLQQHSELTQSYEELMEVPGELIREAAAFHHFAEAAYTGPLLDFGRNPVIFPCSWLYRQGVLTPWTRNRRPKLEGDNWWRGHAAAFLKNANIPPESLRKGRVSQAKREAAYFVVVLHHLKSVVIAVRGTETPEDLITDGLCRECSLSEEDLDGLINSNYIRSDVKQNVISSFPHYGHSGIVEAARELFMQIDGQPENGDNLREATGLLSSLMGAGCECFGYKIYVVGHSLGGSIAALLGIQLYHRYPNLHVYSYGPLPFVDPVIGEACQDFITSIVYNDEFSSRLSVRSILRLRAAAIQALSEDPAANSAMICRLANKILHVSKYQSGGQEVKISTPSPSGIVTSEDNNHQMYKRRSYKYTIKGNSEQDKDLTFQEATDLISNSDAAILNDNPDESNCSPPCFENSADGVLCENPVSAFMDHVSSSNTQTRGPQEAYLPGLIIHIVPEQTGNYLSLWRGWRFHDSGHRYRAYIANRENFKDINVSPFMFLDHLPWRCHYAMQKLLDTGKANDQHDGSHMV
ncbi:PREDICTED: uncharacterized protein LOC104586101 isoform X2 [Nelumbo nucifera]|nr:PREDICTED: uncharacterized protein LOC104586101 isoform X2 [Nelumbo nucifera]